MKYKKMDDDIVTAKEQKSRAGRSFTSGPGPRRQPGSTLNVTMHTFLVLKIILIMALCVRFVYCATEGSVGISEGSNENRVDIAVVDILFPRIGTLVGQTFFPGFKLTVPDDDFLQVCSW